MKTLPRLQVVTLIVAIILSLGIVRWDSRGNVPPCSKSPVCAYDASTVGTLNNRKQGYPLVYREFSTFRPNDTSRFAVATSEQEGFSWPSVAINVIFWYALIELLRSYWPAIKSRRSRK